MATKYNKMQARRALKAIRAKAILLFTSDHISMKDLEALDRIAGRNLSKLKK